MTPLIINLHINMQAQSIHLNNFLTPPSTELSPFLMADNQLSICNGVNLGWKKGQITKDLGYSITGDKSVDGKKVTGLHNFRQSSTVDKLLITKNNTTDTKLTLKYNNSGVWTDINVGTRYDGFEDSIVYMEDFIGHCFIVGYDKVDNVFLPVASLTGTTFSPTANVTNMPSSKYIKRYRDRLYVANTASYPYRVYFSSVPEASIISWTTSKDFFDVDYSEQITGLGSNWDRLIVFTEFSSYIYDQSSKVKLGDIGCVNGKTIANLGSYLLWANKDNVWASTGGRPTPIASDIKELLLNSNPEDWRATVVANEYNLYLGSTEANGITYKNCLCTFDGDLGCWRWRELNDAMSEVACYTNNNEDFLVLGTGDGNVYTKSKYTDPSPSYTDNGEPIIAHFRTRAFDFGDPSVQKTVSKVIAYCKNAQQLMLRFRIYNKNNEVVMPFTDIGRLSEVINVFPKQITGNFIEFEGKEYSGNAPFEFWGLSVLLGIDSKL